MTTNVQGYLIEVSENGAHIGVRTPTGDWVSCLRRGTHTALSVLPDKIRYVAEVLAGWR